jgi:hypothetical protein
MAKIKRRLTHDEEFQVMKLVLDKFLWLGTAFIGWGLYQSVARTFLDGLWYLIAGAMIMLVFAWIVISEFEQLR